MKTICKRLLSVLLVLVLVFGLLPSAYAATDDGTEPVTQPTETQSTAATEAATEPTSVTESQTEPAPSTEPPPSDPESTEAPTTEVEETVEPESTEDPAVLSSNAYDIMTASSTSSGVLLFDYADNGNYTTVLDSQVAVDYKPNGTGSTKTAYIRNLGWHFARYNNTSYPDDPIYCIEPHKNFGASTSGNSVDRDVTLDGGGSSTGSNAWYSLPKARRTAIGMILLYSNEMWDHSVSVTTTSKSNNPNVPLRIATQFLIYEIVCGLRDPETFESNSSNECGTEGDVFYNAGASSVPYFAPNYNSLVNSIQSALKIPSFTGSSSATAPTITLTGEETSVYDSNEVLPDFSFTNGSGASFDKVGSTLYITQTGTISESTVYKATKNIPSAEASTYSLWYMSGSSYQTTISLYTPSSGNLNAYFKLKAPAKGSLNLTKTTDDGANLAGWRFGIYTNAACTSLASGPHTTNSSGKISVAGLAAGTYYVKELGHTNSEIQSQYVCSSTNPQRVTISNGSTASVSFANKRNAGSLALTKSTEDGKNLSGWKFGIYSDSACTSLVSGPHTTDYSGRISVSNLTPGVYYVKEIGNTTPATEALYECTVNPQKVTITIGTTATVTFYNKRIPGTAEIIKRTNTGSNLAGWKFNLYTNAACTNLVDGSPFTSGADGRIAVSLIPGTYYIKEVDESSAKPDWTFDTSVKTVTVTAGHSVSVTFTNTHYGYARIVKKTNTGEDVSGWRFQIYTDEACTSQVTGSPFTSGPDGTITARLLPGTYYVKEADTSSRNPDWDMDTTVRKVVVTAGATASVTFTNIHYGYAKIVKETSTGENLAGWKFNIYADETCTTLMEGSPYTSGADGTVVARIQPGKYYVQEIDESTENPDWMFDTTVQEITVSKGETSSVTFTNTHYGYAEIQKATNTGENLGGWRFNIYSDAECTQLISGSPFTSDDSGLITARLLPGTYYVREIDESADKPGWVFDDAVHSVTVKAGETASVRIENNHMGQIKLIKSMPDGGSVSGWTFDIHRADDNTLVGRFTSGEDGTVLSDYLMPGEYQITEQLDDASVYWCESQNPQRITVRAGEVTEVTFVNRLKTGTISIHKVDVTGEPLAGAEFLLEWSADGSTWLPVVYTDSAYTKEGACSSAGLTDGRLISGSDGLVSFTGLHPERLYRLTETKAPEGYLLLAETAYEGGLRVEHDLTVDLTVVNVRTFQLPETGSRALARIPISLALVCGLCAALLLYLKRKNR